MNLYILIWLSWSWKSTYVKNTIKENDLYLSSDKIREELYWDESIQGDWKLVFETLYSRLEEAIKSKKYLNIYVDATHISVKSRNFYTKTLKQKYKNTYLKIIWIEFLINLSENIKRDRERDRTVWEKVIYSMYTRYKSPSIQEWFDKVITNKTFEKLDIRFLKALKIFLKRKDLNQFFTTQDTNYLFHNILYCEQKSKYHQEDLFTHLELILKEVETDTEYLEYNKLFLLLTLFHDIWKPITQTRKFENLLFRGYIQDENNSKIFYNKKWEEKVVENFDDFQFIWHEKVSWDLFKNEFKECLINDWIITDEEALIIETIIYWHLLFHSFNRDDQEVMINNKIYNEDDLIYKLWIKFSDYDSNWRVTL